MPTRAWEMVAADLGPMLHAVAEETGATMRDAGVREFGCSYAAQSAKYESRRIYAGVLLDRSYEVRTIHWASGQCVTLEWTYVDQAVAFVRAYVTRDVGAQRAWLKSARRVP